MRRRERIRKAGRVLRDPATSEEERRDARALLLREMRETKCAQYRHLAAWAILQEPRDVEGYGAGGTSVSSGCAPRRSHIASA